MRVSEKWLRTLTNPPVDSDRLAEQLTMAGLEVETVEKFSQSFKHIIAAEVIEVSPHPESDTLKICRVSIDKKGKTVSVITGANNVRPFMRVVLALPGASLSGNQVISTTDIKGIRSEGMLCSAAELGLADEADILLELPVESFPGQDLKKIFNTQDTILGFSLTPNRGDCLSITGIAREVSVINNCSFNGQTVNKSVVKNKHQRPVKLDAPKACPQYVGRIIENVNMTGVSPPWLIERLYRSGLRSINPVVDITNYVMIELGQPMHAFDDDKLQGSIHVRFANKNEKLVLLDGQEYQLSGDTLVIADDKQALAMAGVMGGQDTAVTRDSKTIFLESAWFEPKVIIGEGRRYGLHTGSSHRFERHVDHKLQDIAMERATQLVLEICGGKPGPVTTAVSEKDLPQQVNILLSPVEIQRILGIDIETKTVVRILKSLGMKVVKHKNGFLLTPPSYRNDISIEADLIEELARILGYDTIPAETPLSSLYFHEVGDSYERMTLLRQLLAHRGYQEAITYSFVDNRIQKRLFPDVISLDLANPIAADLAVMRTSLWPGLLGTLAYNLRRQQDRVRLFEIGRVFQKSGLEIEQTPMIGGLIYGNIYVKQWDSKNISSNFFHIKSDIEAILCTFGHPINNVHFVPVANPALHPGQSAEIMLENQCVGYAGALHPTHQNALEIPEEVFLFELQVQGISKQLAPRYQKLSKFPLVKRDMAIVVDEKIPVSDIMVCIQKTATELLTNLELFDVYQGEGIDLGKKSLALGLTFQKSSSTLIEAEVEATMGDILAKLRDTFGGTLRE